MGQMQTREKEREREKAEEGVLRKLKKLKKGKSYELREKFEEIKRIYLGKYEMRVKMNLEESLKKSKAKSCNTFHQKEHLRRKKQAILVQSKEVRESEVYESPFDKLSAKAKKLMNRYKDSLFAGIKRKIDTSIDKKGKSTREGKKANSRAVLEKSRSLSKSQKKRDPENSKRKKNESRKPKKNKQIFDEQIKFSKRFGTSRGKSVGKRGESRRRKAEKTQPTQEDKLRPRKPVKLGTRASNRKKKASRKAPMSVGKVRFNDAQVKSENKGRGTRERREKLRSKSVDKKKKPGKFNLEIVHHLVGLTRT